MQISSDSDEHPLNTDAAMLVTPVPIVHDVNEVHASKVNANIVARESGRTILSNAVQFVNAEAPRFVRFEFIVTDINDVHPANAPVVMPVTPVPRVQDVSEVHPENAPAAIVASESGAVTVVSDLQPVKPEPEICINELPNVHVVNAVQPENAF